jgi:tripartite-type tricarboxylate transporter receptor subunit TctC
MMVGKSSPIRTLEDLLKTKREIKCATIDPTTGSSVNAALAAEGLGLNLKIVPGFQNGKLCGMAVLRGEIEMTLQPPAGFEEEFKKGDLRAISIAAGREVALAFQSLFASVPRLIDLPLSQDKKIYIALSNHLNDIGFVMAGPPGIPKDRVQFLENALAKAMKEPQVFKIFEGSGYAFSPLSGTEYLQILKGAEKVVADISVKSLNHILFEKYY